MDSLTYGTIQRLVNEALQQSPHNPKSNGYGLALGVILFVGILCVGGFVFGIREYIRYRNKQDARRDKQAAEDRTERENARTRAAEQIDGRFDQMRRDINEGIDEIQGKVEHHIGNLEKQHADFGKELTRLKTIVEFMQKGDK